MIDLIVHVCYLFLFAGMVLIRRRNKIGWVLWFLGEFGWVLIGIKLGLTSVWVWGILFCAIDLNALKKWNSGRDHG